MKFACGWANKKLVNLSPSHSEWMSTTDDNGWPYVASKSITVVKCPTKLIGYRLGVDSNHFLNVFPLTVD